MKKKEPTPPSSEGAESNAQQENNDQAMQHRWPTGPHVFSLEEMLFHMKDRFLKSCFERIMAHNFDLLFAVHSWIAYLAEDGDMPASRLSTDLNPEITHAGNNARNYITTLVKLLVVYGEGRCPQPNISEYCFNSTLTLLDRLRILRPSLHLELAEEAISQIFGYAMYQGERTMSEDEYERKLYELMNRFISECAHNARELSIYLADAVARKHGDDEASRIYRNNSHSLQMEDQLKLITRNAFHKDIGKLRQDISDSDINAVLPRKAVRSPDIAPIRGCKNTKLMQEQRREIINYVYLELHKRPQDMTLADVVHVWNLPKNKKRWDAGARRKDRGRGYKDCMSAYTSVRSFVDDKNFDITKMSTH